jgi:hypothetical protein
MDSTFKKGSWFRQVGAAFGFKPVILCVFEQERATEISEWLRSSGIETKVVKV